VRIRPPGNDFRHAGELDAKLAGQDPRGNSFRERAVEIDLRRCAFVRPAAALWCLIYPLLAKQKRADCTLLVPTDAGACEYLKSLRLFDLLHEAGVQVDTRGIRDRPAPQLVLPLTRFERQDEVERIANEVLDRLSEAGLGAANLYPLVSEAFAELALNAVEHSQSAIAAFGFVQFYEFREGQRFVCGVADGGIGIRASLEKNPALRSRVPYDWAAIELAVRERVTGTGDKTRGIGLYGIAEDMRKPGRQLILHSGIGSLMISEEMETAARRTALFPGTLAYASIPT
jgi:hypothetical protein